MTCQIPAVLQATLNDYQGTGFTLLSAPLMPGYKTLPYNKPSCTAYRLPHFEFLQLVMQFNYPRPHAPSLGAQGCVWV